MGKIDGEKGEAANENNVRVECTAQTKRGREALQSLGATLTEPGERFRGSERA